MATRPSPPAPEMQHVRSGAVGAMGRSLGRIAGAAGSAGRCIAAGDAVIEILDATSSIPSFVTDRLGRTTADPEPGGIDSESGPASADPGAAPSGEAGQYQIAYGHRRVRACRARADRSVRSCKDLSDEDLVVAQGQENSARTDLSYIERARFASRSTDSGLRARRDYGSLKMDKTQLSRLLASAMRSGRDREASARAEGRPAALEALSERWFRTACEGRSEAAAEPRFLAARHKHALRPSLRRVAPNGRRGRA